jgi:uncharacterized protein
MRSSDEPERRMSGIRVTALHLHPIKGCHRVEVDRARVSPYGLEGDREWQLVAEDGDFITQRRRPELTQIRPAITEDGVVLQAPGRRDLAVSRSMTTDTVAKHYTGEAAMADAGDDAAAWLSEMLGERVRMVGIAPGYVRATGLFATESNLGDAAPVLLVNEASHRFLADRATEPFGLDRWRGNVVIEGAEPFAEDTWRTVRVGTTTVTLVYPWPRCAVPQVDQSTGERRREPALVLKAHRWCDAVETEDGIARAILPGNALFGVGAAIVPEGATIAVGDEVEVLETTMPFLPFATAG